jgi:anthranilate phosphoribosyltransferase
LDILNKRVDDDQIKELLLALKAKGETYTEIAGFAKTLKVKSLNYNTSLKKFYDIVGTGGDKLNTFNISTTCAFVLSAIGLNIAKHGNRSASSKCGSIDVLDELSIDTSVGKLVTEKQLDEVGLSFIFAQTAHPLMKNVSVLRKDLATPTIFNLVGPLSNPIKLSGQVLGVYKKELLPLMSQALTQIGVRNSAVIYGFGGMDEASLEGDNVIIFTKEGKSRKEIINCQDFGMNNASNSSLVGGNKKENAKILRSVLNNEQSDYLEVVVFNCAIALYTFDFVESIEEGISLTRETLASKSSLLKLQALQSKN